MTPVFALTLYCVLILLASLTGGWIPHLVRLTHRRMELALSFVSGVMLGVALLHLLPHAILEQGAADGHVEHEALDTVILWLLGGFLVLFLLERFFSFHHHDAPHDDPGDHDHDHDHAVHGHSLTWGGAAIGLSLHTLIAGVALAASVESEQREALVPAGLGTFMVIVLHKPFDALTIGTLMAAGRRPALQRHVVNGLFSLLIPLGVILFFLGFGRSEEVPHGVLAAALAFSAGAFLCIALSDLLPELQFHQHDRWKLTIALVLGLVVAWGVRALEHRAGDHEHEATAAAHVLTAHDR
ncbi:MAG: ZIP family metal transporter [Planctomycetes bacterium]|nr:ZIP family metal transporter [Planctomycetota bacterium]